MKRNLVPVILCLAVLLAVTSVSSAQTGAKAPGKTAAPPAGTSGMSMKPAPEMDKAKWMAGNWQCAGKTMASPMGPEHPSEATVAVEMTLDGFWLVSHYREKKTAQNPMPVSGDEYWTYNSSEKMWDRVAVDNMGVGGFATGTSKGWEKGKLVWMSEGMMGGQKTKFRDTFVEKNPREITYTGEIGSADGKFSTVWDIACKK
jgi:hypothetical protein